MATEMNVNGVYRTAVVAIALCVCITNSNHYGVERDSYPGK